MIKCMQNKNKSDIFHGKCFLLACGKLIMPINNKGWGEGGVAIEHRCTVPLQSSHTHVAGMWQQLCTKMLWTYGGRLIILLWSKVSSHPRHVGVPFKAFIQIRWSMAVYPVICILKMTSVEPEIQAIACMQLLKYYPPVYTSLRHILLLMHRRPAVNSISNSPR